MEANDDRGIQAAEVVLPCAELDDTLAFFTDRLGFRVEAISPADGPTAVVVSGHGLRVRLERDAPGGPGVLRLACRSAVGVKELVAPNGTVVRFVDADPPMELPPLAPSLAISRAGDDALWGTGRAGMRYRDLVPCRQGGRFIASHIRIPGGGAVPDYVHFHRVRFQMIYCYTGWVRVVYEDQGPPFVMNAGDCVLQPPGIRHRVLECSRGLEVIEVSSPADHSTFADHGLELPTATVDAGRDFSGQRFVRHDASAAEWGPWRVAGFEARDVGIGAATDGLAGVRVARSTGTVSSDVTSHDAEFVFTFVLKGSLTLRSEGRDAEALSAGDSFVVPAGLSCSFDRCASGLELLEVSLPAEFETSLG